MNEVKNLKKEKNMLHRLLFDEKANITKRTYTWNLVSSLLFSVQSAVFLLVAKRVSGETDAGVFIILFTVAQTLTSLGNYNIRDYQVSDIHEEYKFSTYYTARLLTESVMLVAALGYAFIKKLDVSGVVVLMCLVGYRFVEGVEDCYHGVVHRKGRFDVTSICMSLRIIISSTVFIAVYIITKDQVTASVLLLVSSIAVYLVTIRVIKAEYPELKIAFSFDGVVRLLTVCFPIFIGAFLYSYLINAPKYAIDSLMPKNVQTVYNILFMPIFVVNILSMFIYKPIIVKLSNLWDEGDTKGFFAQMIKQCVLIAVLDMVIVAGGFVIGLKLLGIIYAAELSEYMGIFCLLLMFGGVTAMGYYLNVLITIMRKQFYILIGYGAAFAVSLLTTRRLVSTYGIGGAAYAYGVIACAIMLIYLIAICFETGRRKKNDGAKKRVNKT